MLRSLRVAAGAGALLLAGMAASSAGAVTVVSACKNTDISPTAAACSGWYDGNLLNDKHIADQQAGLAAIGYTWGGNWAVLDVPQFKIGVSGPGADKNEYNWSDLLNGTSYIGIHKGKGGAGGFESTAFFRIVASNLDIVKLNLKGGSDAVLYANNIITVGTVPEPGTWALMTAGIAGVGAALRRKRRPVAAAATA